MTKASPGILILGGGVAGMAAARTLENQDIPVHLVEKRETLGGHAAKWSCMATDTCQNCGACLALEMADQVSAQKNVTTHLNTKLLTLEKTGRGFKAGLDNDKSITAARVIMATGFSPFDPAKICSFHMDTQKKVITTAELNKLIREEKLAGFMGDAKAPKIAFLQCVGSRNREEKKDYCSQACCKISMRHAQKLLHLLPDAGITLFYMDLQVLGKEIRTMAEELVGLVEFAQGVPGEILTSHETSALSMITEDPVDGSRKSREFDLVVLSVGMEPAGEQEETFQLLKAVPNSWGFFNTENANPGPDTFFAGCAAGPKDIFSSIREGKIAGQKALEALGLDSDKNLKVAILGRGPQALTVAAALDQNGYRVSVLGTGPGMEPDTIPNAPEGIRFLPGADLQAIEGSTGNFLIYYEDRGKKNSINCNALIAAPEPGLIQNTAAFPLAIDIDTFAGTAPEKIKNSTLILLDYFGPESKSMARKALTAAVAAKKAGKEIFILMKKMLVHKGRGQLLYDHARSLGIKFLRYEDPADISIEAKGEDLLRLTLREATLSPVTIEADINCLVVPSTIKPAPEFEKIAKHLSIPLDREGFLKPANARHRQGPSPRKGIFFAGSCHDETDRDDLDTEIKEILAGLALLNRQGLNLEGVKINENRCAQCLTCYRICPHSAIVLNEDRRPDINPEACFSCHLCQASCPAQAIESAQFTTGQIEEKIEKGKTAVLACERSALLAARNLSLEKSARIIPIPCACRISPDMILKTMLKGASRVILTGCHQGNCRSDTGHGSAENTVEAVLSIPGLPKEKLAWFPIAANETEKLSKTLSGLGATAGKG